MGLSAVADDVKVCSWRSGSGWSPPAATATWRRRCWSGCAPPGRKPVARASRGWGSLAYLALGDEAARQGAENLKHYYRFLGGYAQMVADSMLTSEQAMRDALRAFEAVGVTELYMDPAAASLDQVDRLADAIA